MGLLNLIRKWLGYKFILNTHTGEAHVAKAIRSNCGVRYMKESHKHYITRKQYNKLLISGDIHSCRWCLKDNTKEISDSDHSWWIG